VNERSDSSDATPWTRRIVCERLSDENPLGFLGAEQRVEGFVAIPPAVGHALLVHAPDGSCLLQTSAVQRIEGDDDALVVETENAIYRITPHREESARLRRS
jgi:hypothetical protein